MYSFHAKKHNIKGHARAMPKRSGDECLSSDDPSAAKMSTLLVDLSNASQATGPADNTRLDHRNNILYFFASCCPDLRPGRQLYQQLRKICYSINNNANNAGML
ncbi:hypothetical protein NC653_040281 [Populus alba x Populus x berolinensis]|uniref:Uncharacterized protein n=1 Tax=Populus alba x Populus x berolinensis TaxID=444605 RepID=A0AAD6LDU2_9ROSI|nr:hypothetical protein NC653_040281 [Populus alba x Populus x berolinensis]